MYIIHHMQYVYQQFNVKKNTQKKEEVENEATTTATTSITI